MSIPISDTQALACKRHLAVNLRSIGIRDIAEFEPHALSWNQLHERKKALTVMARDLYAKLDDKTPDEETRSVEAAFDGVMLAVDEISSELDVRTELGDRAPRNHGGDPRRPHGDDSSTRADGSGQHRDAHEDVSPLLRPEQRMADLVKSASRASDGLTVGRYLRAMVRGSTTEAERRALAEGSDSAGGYSVPDVLSASLIDLMRAQTVAIKAGANTVPLTSDKNHIARLATDPVPAWRSENATVNESDPTFARVTFEPKSLAVLVKVSRELLEDSLNIETELPRILAAAMARELDRVVFLGTGANDEPSGLDTISGVLSQAHDSAIESYAPLVTARKSLMGQNVERVSAYVMHPDVEAEFGGLTDTTGQPLRHPPILDRPEPLNFLTTTQLPVDLGDGSNESTIYCGDFSQLVIGLRSDVRVEVLKERYMDNLQYGFICHARYDVAAIHPQAFLRITGVTLA